MSFFWNTFVSVAHKVLSLSLSGFCFAAPFPQIYPPPSLPRSYRPVHHFRPVLPAGSDSCQLQKALQESAGKLQSEPAPHCRHALNAAQRREQLGEAELKGRNRPDHGFACVSRLFVCLVIEQ